jgi:predicted short-subunit dehydrogenase-like oxidoreductase (DUF2520 family)
MKVTIIGSGNVATVLGRKITDAGHQVHQVFSPNHQHARELADLLRSEPISDWKSIDANADIYIVAIGDPYLLQIGNHLSFLRKTVVHTAGSVSMEILQSVSKNYGILYPLQSLRKELESLPEITMLVNGNTRETLTLVHDFAKTFADRVEVADDNMRQKLHLAAVVVNNFSNHLYTLAENYCRTEGVDFLLLLPLIEETAKRLRESSPQEMQTGPAVRHDDDTIRRHLELLQRTPELKELYSLMTDSISKFHREGHP